jgi:hypothetical protein
MRSVFVTMGFCALALLTACGSTPTSQQAAQPLKPAEPAIPAEITSVAQTVLGTEAEVLVFGDLAHTGNQQILVINRMPKPPADTAPGNLLTRAVIVENSAGKWRELLRCDEYLKNASGYLGGTPFAPVNGWRLQFEQDSKKGLLLYFTPLKRAGTEHPSAIGVRWDSQVKRYRSLDRNYENFLPESPALDVPNMPLR